MNQPMLWHEDIYEALGTDIQALGGRKKVGTLLWPEMTPQAAGDKLSRALNTEHAEKLRSRASHFNHQVCPQSWFIRGYVVHSRGG